MSARREILRWGALLAALVALGLLLTTVDRIRLSRAARAQAAALTGGDPERGRALMVRYGCSTCHAAPGVWPAAQGVGPSLAGLSRRMYMAGVLLNTPDNLIAWIVDPRGIDPRTAMPRTGITEPEARDVAAFLYSAD